MKKRLLPLLLTSLSLAWFPQAYAADLQPTPLPSDHPWVVSLREYLPFAFDPPSISAEHYLVVDLDTHQVLLRRAEDEQIAPASLTKLMTALVALETDPRPESIVTSYAAATQVPVQMGFSSGEEFSFETLLQASLIQSANDAAYALAEACGPGIESFIERMNSKAAVLGMENTHFTNPHGLDEDDHYSTLTDIARLSIAAIEDPTIAQIVQTESLSVSTIDESHWFRLKTSNPLLGTRDDIKGIKTGYTDNAGQAISLLVEQPQQRLLVLLLKSYNRGQDGEALIEYIQLHRTDIQLPTFDPQLNFYKMFLGVEFPSFFSPGDNYLTLIL